MDEAFAPQDPLGILAPGPAPERAADKATSLAVVTGRGLPAADESQRSPGLSEVKTGEPATTGRSTSLRDGIIASASALGVSPLDLATAISYETAGTFNPTKRGPTTQWGQHQGLIQFGKPQAAKYGVDWNDPLGSQLGENGAVVRYLKDTGVRPGMGLLDIYSAINAGGVGRYNRTDANNGGAPGTVADKVNNQMSGHRAKAAALLGGHIEAPAATAAYIPGQSPPAPRPDTTTAGLPLPRIDQKSRPRFMDDRDDEAQGSAIGLLAHSAKPATAPGLQLTAPPRAQGRSANVITEENPDVVAEIASIDGKIADVQRIAHTDPNAAAQLAALQQRRNSLSAMV